MFFLFISCYFYQLFYDPRSQENAKLKLALVIHIGALTTLANETIETPQLVADKTIKDLSRQSKVAI